MSRTVEDINKRFTLITGDDHMVGKFIQLYDKLMSNETPEGEGLVFEWIEQNFGKENDIVINLIGLIPLNYDYEIALSTIKDYINKEMNNYE